MKLRTHLPLILSGLTVAPAAALALPSLSCPQAEMATAVEDSAVPEGLASGDWASIRAAYEAGRHAFFTAEEGHRARSHGNAWRAEFDGQGFFLEPDAGDWSFGLELEGYGFESALARVDQSADVLLRAGLFAGTRAALFTGPMRGAAP